MGLKDEPVERRRMVFQCDRCGVREIRFYDAPRWDFGTDDPPFEHEWRLVPNDGSEHALAFCSQACLTAHHDAIVERAYGPALTVT